MYELLEQDNGRNDIFSGLSEVEWRSARKVVVGSILATDMVHHFKMVSDLDIFYDANSAVLNGDKAKRRSFLSLNNSKGLILHMFMHAGDVSNPAKPFHICEVWAHRVMNEFFNQGDEEKAHGMTVSPFMDRDNTVIPQVQFNFIEFVVAPLYIGVLRIFPELNELGTNLVENQRKWLKIYMEEHPEADSGPMKTRNEQFSKKLEKILQDHRDTIASNKSKVSDATANGRPTDVLKNRSNWKKISASDPVLQTRRKSKLDATHAFKASQLRRITKSKSFRNEVKERKPTGPLMRIEASP